MMKWTRHRLLAFAADQSGLSAVEYGLLAAGIAIGLWTLVSEIGGSLHSIFESVRDSIGEAAPSSGP